MTLKPHELLIQESLRREVQELEDKYLAHDSALNENNFNDAVAVYEKKYKVKYVSDNEPPKHIPVR